MLKRFPTQRVTYSGLQHTAFQDMENMRTNLYRYATLCYVGFTKKTGYSVILAVVEGGQKYTIDYIDTENNILPQISEIMPDDIYRTATGRIIMANMDKSDIKRIFEKNGIPPEGHWDEVSSLETLEAKLSELAKNGISQTYYIGNDDKIMLGYAAAIFKYTTCVGAIGVAVLCTSEEYEQFEEKEKLIKLNIIKAKSEIGRRLKYS